MFKIIFLTLMHFNIYASYTEQNNGTIDYVVADDIQISNIDTKIRGDKFIISMDRDTIVYDITFVDNGYIYALLGDEKVTIYGDYKQLYIMYDGGYTTLIRDKAYKMSNINNDNCNCL